MCEGLDRRRDTDEGSAPIMMIGTRGSFARTFVTKVFTASVILEPSGLPFSMTLSEFREPMVTMRFGAAAQTALTRESTSKERLPSFECAKPEPSTEDTMGIPPMRREMAAGRLKPAPIMASVLQESPK